MSLRRGLIVLALLAGCTAAPRGLPPGPPQAPAPLGTVPAKPEPAPDRAVHETAVTAGGTKTEAAPDAGRKKETATRSRAAGFGAAGLAAVTSPAAGDASGGGEDLTMDAGAAEPPAGSVSARAAGGGGPAVKAAFSDDNREFGAFLDYRSKFGGAVLVPLDVSNRITFTAADGQGQPLAGATAVLRDAQRAELARRTAYADGRFMIFPSEYRGGAAGRLNLDVAYGGETRTLAVEPDGPRSVQVAFKAAAKPPARVPVDICFLLDTTGSMGDEIQRLKQVLAQVHAALTGLDEKPALRFGMVLYRDRSDEYLTRVTAFTADVNAFATALDPVRADGGGDAPEDLQAGLDDALKKLDWRKDAVKVIFVITDAPPHVYKDEPTYMASAQAAAARGIKIVGIGASGLDAPGEMTLRQLAQYTMGEFVFLTYGETGESEGGTPVSVSHHTGANFQSRDLDAIIVRFVRSELAARRGTKLADDDWMEAGPPGAGESNDAVLVKLADEGVRRLLDYALSPVEPRTPLAVVPLAANAAWKAAAENLEHQVLMAASRNPAFALVERKDLRQVMGEVALGLTGAVAEQEAAKAGKLIGAKLMIIGSFSPPAAGGRAELLLKLVRVETAEILSVSLLKLDPVLLR